MHSEVEEVRVRLCKWTRDESTLASAPSTHRTRRQQQGSTDVVFGFAGGHRPSSEARRVRSSRAHAIGQRPLVLGRVAW